MKPSDYDDAYVETAPGIAGAMCTQCGAIKPTAEFKRRLTRAQARARGCVGNVLLEIDSSLCKPCQPKRKPMAERSIKEVLNLVGRDELRPALAAVIVEKKREKAKWAQRNAAEQRWLDARTKPLKAHITREINRSMQARNYHAKQNRAHLLEFYDLYLPLLRSTKAQIETLAHLKKLPKVEHWIDVTDQERRIEALEAWEAVPLAQRTAARRMPEIVQPTAVFSPNPYKLPPALLPSERRARELQQEWSQERVDTPQPAPAQAKPQSADTTPWEDL